MIPKKSTRRILREKCLQILYAYKMNGERLEYITNALLAEIEDPEDRLFARELVNKTLSNESALERKIKSRVDNWELDRIATIDKLLLKIGIAELLYCPDIPPKVSINEVIEIAKDFSTSNSGKFINGILDAILSDLKEKGELNKIGRGLIENSLPKKSEE